MTEIKLTLDDLKDDGEHVEVWNLREHADVLGRKGFSWVASLVRNIANQIEEQVKPVVEEPEEFASVVRAGIDGLSDRVLWQRSASGYWFSETSRRAWWPNLYHPEVLRVGLGDEYSPSLQQIRDLLFRSPTGSLTTEEIASAYKALRKGLSGLLAGEKALTASDLSRMSIEAHQGKLAAEREAYTNGARDMAARIHASLVAQLAVAISAERKNALEKAIQAVEELAP
jgi:hypothetical protein